MTLVKINKFKVGYNHRKDVYTQKLGFINPIIKEYEDETKNKYQYAKSYDNWKDKNIKEDIFDNEPLSGFVLNYRVGGTSYGWSGREPKFRVLDPRGFEIEITLDNLVDLTEFGMGKGKLFEGELIYVMYNGRLTLINVEDSRYKELYEVDTDDVEYNKEDFIVGGIYQTSENGNESGFYIYLGNFYTYYETKTSKNNVGQIKKTDFFYGFKWDKTKYPDIKNQAQVFTNSWMVSKGITKSKIKYFHGITDSIINPEQIRGFILKNTSDLSKSSLIKRGYGSDKIAFGYNRYTSSIFYKLPNKHERYVTFTSNSKDYVVDMLPIDKFITYEIINGIGFYQVGNKKYLADKRYLDNYYQSIIENIEGVQKELINPKITLEGYFNAGHKLPMYHFENIVKDTDINGLVQCGEISSIEEFGDNLNYLYYVSIKGKNITNDLIKINNGNSTK